MQSFDSIHTEQILLSFGEFMPSLGFKKRARDLYVRNADDGIMHGVELGVFHHDGELHLTPSLAVFHNVVARLIDHGAGERRREAIQADPRRASLLQCRPVKFLTAQRGGDGASPGYVISEPRHIDGVVLQMFEDIATVSSEFFASQKSLDLLIRRFETDPEAGGGGRLTVLMTLYFVASRPDDLLSLVRSLDEKIVPPMTIAMRDYLLARLREGR